MENFHNLDLIEKISFASKKYGNDGTKTTVKANFAPISIKADEFTGKCLVYQYNIEISFKDIITNDGDSKKFQMNTANRQMKMIHDSSFEIFQRFYVEQLKTADCIFNSEPLFDGRKIIYSKTKLKMKNEKCYFNVRVKVPEKKFPQAFIICITRPKDAHEIDLTVLNRKDVLNAEKELHCLDTIISYGPRRFDLVFGSNIFKKMRDLIASNQAHLRFNLGFLKEATFGNYQASKLTENGIQLNVDRVAMVFNKGGKLLDLIEEFINESRNSRGGFRGENQRSQNVRIDKGFRLEFRELQTLNTELKGLSFTADHLEFRPKNTFFEFSEKPISELVFHVVNDNNERIQTTVLEYYSDKYKNYLKNNNIQLLGNLLAVNCGNKMSPIYFPIEVVRITEDQYSFKKLNDKQQKIMVKTCAEQTPFNRFDENQAQIENLIQTSKKCTLDYLNFFGINLCNQFPTIEARLIEAPELVGLNDENKIIADGQWKDNSYAVPFVGGKDFNWIVVNFSKERKVPIKKSPCQDQILGLIGSLKSNAENNGLKLPNPIEIIFDEVYNGRLSLEDTFKDYEKNYNPQFILFLIPFAVDELYANIKYLSEIKFGFISQCVSHSKSNQFSKPAYINNLLLKINSKLGGINFYLPLKRKSYGDENKVGHLRKKTMIMGLDLTHPSKHDRFGKSIASVVATYDSKMINYYCKTLIQPESRPDVVKLDELTFELLENFYEQNKKPGKDSFFPDFLLVYRNGVNESQFKDVMDIEIKKMKEAFLKIERKYNIFCEPAITFIVVQKRHHTRFIPENSSDGYKNNVKPGLVVDRGIVSNYFEFYLCSHPAGKGTSRPTRYIVVYDESEFTGDEIQKTTYYLTYLFTRCTKSLSLPPPVEYSHLAIKRARFYLNVLDDNRGLVFGKKDLDEKEILKLNKEINVRPNLKNTLYFV